MQFLEAKGSCMYAYEAGNGYAEVSAPSIIQEILLKNLKHIAVKMKILFYGKKVDTIKKNFL